MWYNLLHYISITSTIIYIFASSLGLYYGLLNIFLTNTSVIVIAYAHDIRYFHDFTLNKTRIATLPLPCDTNSSALIEIWPKRSETTNMIRRPSCVYEPFTIIEYAGLLQSDESVHESIHDVNRPMTTKHMIRKFINIAAAFLLVLPGIVLLALRVYSKHDVSISIASDYCNRIEITVMVLSMLKCFYLLQTE